MADKAETQGNLKLASDLLKQAAEEMSSAYANKRELSGPGGGPIAFTGFKRVIEDHRAVEKADDAVPA